MTSARQRRHRRPAPVRRDPRRLGALVVLASVSALGAVAGPVAGADTEVLAEADVGALIAPHGAAASFAARQQQLRGAPGVSRDLDRGAVSRTRVTAAPEVATPDVVGPLSVPASTPAFAQEDTVARSGKDSSAQVLVEIARGAPVAVTGRTDGGYAEVVLDGAVGWVLAAALGEAAPPEPVAPVEPAGAADEGDGSDSTAPSGSACAGGTGVESGLTSRTVAVHRAVCARFPGLVYGGLRPGDSGEHGSGQALDIMVSGSRGDEVAAYLQDHAADLGIDNLIWKQRIWFVGTSHSAWDGMSDRGSVTANHFDHVHVGTR